MPAPERKQSTATQTPPGPHTPANCAVAPGCNPLASDGSDSAPLTNSQTPRSPGTRPAPGCGNSPRNRSPTDSQAPHTGLHTDPLQPAAQRLRYKLRTVVAPDISRNPVHREQFLQRVDYVLAGDAPVYLQRQAFPEFCRPHKVILDVKTRMRGRTIILHSNQCT